MSLLQINLTDEKLLKLGKCKYFSCKDLKAKILLKVKLYFCLKQNNVTMNSPDDYVEILSNSVGCQYRN